jgi:hypothetical protein
MASETETPALHLVRALHKATGGPPQVWRTLEELDAATTDAIVYATTRGWVVVQAGHSICLTDAGRRLGGSALGRPQWLRRSSMSS